MKVSNISFVSVHRTIKSAVYYYVSSSFLFSFSQLIFVVLLFSSLFSPHLRVAAFILLLLLPDPSVLLTFAAVPFFSPSS